MRNPKAGGEGAEMSDTTAAGLLSALLVTPPTDLEGFKRRCPDVDDSVDVTRLRALRSVLRQLAGTLVSTDENAWNLMHACHQLLLPSQGPPPPFASGEQLARQQPPPSVELPLIPPLPTVPRPIPDAGPQPPPRFVPTPGGAAPERRQRAITQPALPNPPAEMSPWAQKAPSGASAPASGYPSTDALIAPAHVPPPRSPHPSGLPEPVRGRQDSAVPVAMRRTPGNGKPPAQLGPTPGVLKELEVSHSPEAPPRTPFDSQQIADPATVSLDGCRDLLADLALPFRPGRSQPPPSAVTFEPRDTLPQEPEGEPDYTRKMSRDVLPLPALPFRKAAPKDGPGSASSHAAPPASSPPPSTSSPAGAPPASSPAPRRLPPPPKRVPRPPAESTPPVAPAMTIELFASFYAECMAFPDRHAAIRTKYSVADEDAQRNIEGYFKERIANDPEVAKKWEQLWSQLRPWVRQYNPSQP